MEIKTYLNTTKTEVETKLFNIWIGISLGNKYFTKENIKKYILWALKNTKEDVVVLIADKIHSINYQIRNEYTRERALQVALRKGQEIKHSISKIIKSLPEEKQNKINILVWDDIERNSDFKSTKNIILNEFKVNPIFHKRIVEIPKENKSFKFTEEEFKKLSFYALNELPLFIKGIKYDKKIYNLIPYPGLGKIDYLTIDLLNLYQ